jgi:hypothetical protein
VLIDIKWCATGDGYEGFLVGWVGQQVLEPLLGIDPKTGILECSDRGSLGSIKDDEMIRYGYISVY